MMQQYVPKINHIPWDAADRDFKLRAYFSLVRKHLNRLCGGHLNVFLSLPQGGGDGYVRVTPHEDDRFGLKFAIKKTRRGQKNPARSNHWDGVRGVDMVEMRVEYKRVVTFTPNTAKRHAKSWAKSWLDDRCHRAWVGRSHASHDKLRRYLRLRSVVGDLKALNRCSIDSDFSHLHFAAAELTIPDTVDDDDELLAEFQHLFRSIYDNVPGKVPEDHPGDRTKENLRKLEDVWKLLPDFLYDHMHPNYGIGGYGASKNTLTTALDFSRQFDLAHQVLEDVPAGHDVRKKLDQVNDMSPAFERARKAANVLKLQKL